MITTDRQVITIENVLHDYRFCGRDIYLVNYVGLLISYTKDERAVMIKDVMVHRMWLMYMYNLRAWYFFVLLSCTVFVS